MDAIKDGSLVIINDTIHAVGTSDEIISQFPRHRVHKYRKSILLPGLVNVHTHLELPKLHDVNGSSAFVDWILNLVKAKRKLNNRRISEAVQQNIQAIVDSGITSVGEICSHGISPNEIRRTGLRSVIYKELIGMRPDMPQLIPALNKKKPLVQEGYSPHTPYTCSRAILIRIHTLSRQMKYPVCMHVAESRDELRLLRGKNSEIRKLYELAGWDIAWAPQAGSPVRYLDNLHMLDPRFLAVHVVHVSEKDIRILRKSGASVAHCPRSNHSLGVGKMPLRKMIDAGIPVGLGTDSLASVPTLNMWDEMRYARQIHRRDGVSPRDIMRIATQGGADALGLGAVTGSLEVGKRADIIAVPFPKRNTGDICSDLLRETKSSTMTMVNGTFLKP